jgi:hypothetical protein
MANLNKLGLNERQQVFCVVLFYMITALVMVSVNKVPLLFKNTQKNTTDIGNYTGRPKKDMTGFTKYQAGPTNRIGTQ